MRVVLDQVRGHEAAVAIGGGRIIRVGAAFDIPIPLGIVPNKAAHLAILDDPAMPQKGDSFDEDQYQQFFLKEIHIRSIDAPTAGLILVYEFRGLFNVVDTTTLSSVQSQIHPTGKPYYLKYTPPGETQLIKIGTMNSPLALRHLIMSKTVPFQASPDILAMKGTVNNQPWQGLPVGFWFISSVEGETIDEGVTYTYKVVATTKDTEDWSQYEFFEDDTGQPVYVPEATVQALRAIPYRYEVNDTFEGITKVGNHPLADFYDAFGV